MNTTRRHRRLFTAVVAGTLAVAAVAGGQQPVPRERAAILLPPRPVDPGDLPKVARGAADAPTLDSTPVKKANGPMKAPGTGPAWLTGVDPNVKPAAGNVPAKGGNAVRPLTPPQPTLEQPSLLTKGIDKFKGVVGMDRPPGEPVAPPPDLRVPMTATAATPFRGTASNGSPVFAGPPAYRWYGWGSVTPGANPYAPTGQYPRASAGWYSITGATPGAFPVPVMNPVRQAPGEGPPAYAIAPTPGRAGMPLPTNTISSPLPPATPQPQPQPRAMNPVGGPRVETAPTPPRPPIGSKFDSISTSAEPPRAAPLALPTAPVNVPTLTPPPGMKFVPLPTQPPAMPVGPAGGGAPLNVSKPPAAPAPLPVVGGDDSRWQPSTGTAPAPLPTTGGGTWAPATPRGPVQSGTPEPTWQPGATNTRDARPVARAQAPDAEPQHDPIIRLIHELCRGRARDVEVRYTGSRKLSVCFEVRSEPEATALVDDISRRPELGPFQIDFCVFVK